VEIATEISRYIVFILRFRCTRSLFVLITGVLVGLLGGLFEFYEALAEASQLQLLRRVAKGRSRKTA